MNELRNDIMDIRNDIIEFLQERGWLHESQARPSRYSCDVVMSDSEKRLQIYVNSLEDMESRYGDDLVPEAKIAVDRLNHQREREGKLPYYIKSEEAIAEDKAVDASIEACPDILEQIRMRRAVYQNEIRERLRKQIEEDRSGGAK